jgi:hypothetical protein
VLELVDRIILRFIDENRERSIRFSDNGTAYLTLPPQTQNIRKGSLLYKYTCMPASWAGDVV